MPTIVYGTGALPAAERRHPGAGKAAQPTRRGVIFQRNRGFKGHPDLWELQRWFCTVLIIGIRQPQP